jgi:hypothetical protein
MSSPSETGGTQRCVPERNLEEVYEPPHVLPLGNIADLVSGSGSSAWDCLDEHAGNLDPGPGSCGV